MKKLITLGLLASLSAFGQQNSLRATTLTAAISASATLIAVGSATGINAPSSTANVPGSLLFIQDPGQLTGEVVAVRAVSGTNITVTRSGRGGAQAHVSGAMVLVATSPQWFYTSNPRGACTAASVYVSPWLNTTTGEQWLCSSKTLSWVPGWGTAGPAQVLSATATASVAGATAIAGPLVEISGTNAITSFTMSVGWNGQGFCVAPTGAFTTTATNNIAEASTADVNQTLCYTWNANLGTPAFTSSY